MHYLSMLSRNLQEPTAGAHCRSPLQEQLMLAVL
jgi:hypothetical protein